MTRHSIREVDRRYHVFTPQFGKLIFMGKGAQKVRAKLASHLEPFAIVDIELIRGKQSIRVISVERKHAFAKLARSYNHRLLMQTSLALLDRCTKEEDADERLYTALIDWMGFVNDLDAPRPTRLVLLLGSFLLKVMTLIGFPIEMNRCLGCQKDITQDAYWQHEKGGVVCTSCKQSQAEEWFQAREMRVGVLRLLRTAREWKYRDLLQVDLKGDEMDQFAQIIHQVMQYHLPYQLSQPFWIFLQALEINE